ncbi:uncharacterized protein L969DRAFT_49907 [Mixia osmundae IAM 14324]|uniref:Uncharacterized protein n=1 Tax=Mixia osmundae (strain CBS 9802 / IAM 14324 / JCM 22182 / KY 12970) TaxID=764103 RepID=G7E7F0_MIXOS|nr:uncharacterized protein L969DRAFT_49907 [Mixia osmundae IAM 14324]KEI38920.1 hypothetical protein L969DRAFT_49907 [Mixia osmundae IAM 14324]GAA98760.1 hypothetical protein E5Q_05448 [Mixia osmundae IAM 14324]
MTLSDVSFKATFGAVEHSPSFDQPPYASGVLGLGAGTHQNYGTFMDQAFAAKAVTDNIVTLNLGSPSITFGALNTAFLVGTLVPEMLNCTLQVGMTEFVLTGEQQVFTSEQSPGTRFAFVTPCPSSDHMGCSVSAKIHHRARQRSFAASPRLSEARRRESDIEGAAMVTIF